MTELKHGDRVVVTMRRRKIMYETENFWRGQIVGETRDGGAWIVRRDLYKCPTAYHKSFCYREPPRLPRSPLSDQGILDD